MFFAIVTLLTALAMAVTSATFAVVGIMSIFAGLPYAALIMGVVIEAGKLVGVSWVYRFWTEKTIIKYFMLPGIAVAMLLTSMGIFGLLSRAHLEQSAPVGNNTAQIERLDQRITREQGKIKDAETVINQLDETVQVLINFDKISGPTGSRAVRAGQQAQRDQLATVIDEAEDKISTYQDDQYVLSSELRELELEVGPVKYIAELIYEDPETQLEDAVRLVIIAFIFVFDPMAILLLIGANYQFIVLKKKDGTTEIHSLVDNDDDPDDDPGAGLLKIIDVEEDIHEDRTGKVSEALDVSRATPVVNEVKEEKASEKVAETVPPDRSWIRDIPTDDNKIDTKTLLSTIQKLNKREVSADEEAILNRFRGLAKARGIPWDVAKRAEVSTRNNLLRS